MTIPIPAALRGKLRVGMEPRSRIPGHTRRPRTSEETCKPWVGFNTMMSVKTGLKRQAAFACNAFFADPTRSAKASGWLTARSARILRSRSIPATFNPCMNWL